MKNVFLTTCVTVSLLISGVTFAKVKVEKQTRNGTVVVTTDQHSRAQRRNDIQNAAWDVGYHKKTLKTKKINAKKGVISSKAKKDVMSDKIKAKAKKDVISGVKAVKTANTAS